MMIYNARDPNCTGVGLGAVFPVKDSAEVQEEAGGEYVLRMTVPVAADTGWELLEIDRQITALCPVLGEIREQRFRIHSVTLGDAGTTVAIQARHISYDLRYALAGPVEETETKIPASDAAAAMWASIEEDVAAAFTLDAQVQTPVRMGGGKVSVIRALLDTGSGLVRASRARLVRDNTVIRLLPSDNLDSGVTIRRGVDLIGMSLDVDASEVYTRLMPIGQDSKGDLVFLPEKTIDSPRLAHYAVPRVLAWQVPGARIGSKRLKDDGTEIQLTLEDVEGLLREAAHDKLDSGCDLPVDSGSVEYIDLSRTTQYAAVAGLQDVRLYESVTLAYDWTDTKIKKPVCGYLWDPVGLRYTQLQLGDPFRDAGADSFVTSSQRASDARSSDADSRYVLDHLEDHAQFYQNQTGFNNALLVELNALDGEILSLATTAENNYQTLDERITVAATLIDSLEGQLVNYVKTTTYEADMAINAEALSMLRASTDEALATIQATVDDNTASISAVADQAASLVLIKADRTEIEGLLKVVDLESEIASIDFVEMIEASIGKVNTPYIEATRLDCYGGYATLDSASLDSLDVAGVEVSWRECSVMTYVGLSLTLGSASQMRDDGTKIKDIDVVTNASVNPVYTKIRYLGGV